MYKLKLPNVSNSWHDKDYILLEANFQLLVDFIEIECSWMEQYLLDYNYASNLPNFYSFLYKKINTIYRYLTNFKPSPELGLQYLTRWEKELSKLNKDPETNKVEIEYIKEDLLKNYKIIDLYLWWKQRERNREIKLIKLKIELDRHINYLSTKYNLNFNLNNTLRILKISSIIEKSTEIENTDKIKFNKLNSEYFGFDFKTYEEDTNKLVELIKIREYLWV